MGSHPVNLFFRFILELVFLVVFSLWGYRQIEGWPSVVLAVFMPGVVMLVWGIFNVPDDPSRSGKAPVPVPGILRLFIEFSIFGFALWFLHDLGYQRLCIIYGVLVIIHYIFSIDRISWLLSR